MIAGALTRRGTVGREQAGDWLTLELEILLGQRYISEPGCPNRQSGRLRTIGR